MTWRKFFGRTSILREWWFGVVWTGRSSRPNFKGIHSAQGPFLYYKSFFNWARKWFDPPPPPQVPVVEILNMEGSELPNRLVNQKPIVVSQRLADIVLLGWVSCGSRAYHTSQSSDSQYCFKPPLLPAFLFDENIRTWREKNPWTHVKPCQLSKTNMVSFPEISQKIRQFFGEFAKIF